MDRQPAIGRQPGTKQGATKEEIIRLISQGDNTLSAICKKLDLAPSTVSKHIQDLEDSGIITQRDTPFRKWKYYDLNPSMNVEMVRRKGITLSKGLIVSCFVIAGLLTVFYASGAFGSSAGASYIPISLTDPPHVPQGTQSLYINYSSLSVEVKNGHSSSWLDLNSSGRLDLMTLINESEVIGLANIKPNSTVEAIRFNITSSSITIDNATYDVYVPTQQVLADIGNGMIKNASSGILLDFEPTVAVIGGQNATEFVLVPMLKAAVAQNSGAVVRNASVVGIHLVTPFIGGKMFPPSIINATVTGATLSTSGNYISFSATVKNGGMDNLTIVSMALENSSAQQNGKFVMTAGNGNAGFGMPQGGGIAIAVGPMQGQMPGNSRYFTRHNGTGNGFVIASDTTPQLYTESNSTVTINASALYPSLATQGGIINITPRTPASRIVIAGFGMQKLLMQSGQAFSYGFGPSGINFIVESNGTLSVPTDMAKQFQFVSFNSIGYTVTPGSSETFSYSGSIGNSIGQVNQSSGYKLVIFTNMGPLIANVTT